MTEFLWPYLSLAFSAFISATLLPFGSELVLVGLLTQGYPALLLWGIATVFNTLGSVLNWYLGRQLLLFQHKSWFMFKPTQIEQASSQFQRWGLPSLLLAWLPVIGDPLTLVAGVLRVRLLWFVLLELALGRYLMTQSELFWLLAGAPMILSLALANLVIMLFAEFALPRLRVQANQTLVRLAALILIAPLTLGAGLAAWDNGYQLNLLVYLPLTAALTLWYWRQRRDVLILALLAFSAITVATAMLASLLESADDFFAMNFLALFVIGASAGTVIWLKKLLPVSSKKNSLSNHLELTTQLQHASIIDAAKAQQLQIVTSPWWLQILLGIAAWIASILIVGSFLGPLLALADNNPVRTVAAVALLAAAIWLTSRKQEFLQQMAGQ